MCQNMALTDATHHHKLQAIQITNHGPLRTAGMYFFFPFTEIFDSGDSDDSDFSAAHSLPA